MLSDPEQHPLAVNTLSGNLLWLPRPWWQLLLVILTVLGLVGALVALIWWLFLKPPVLPQIVTFEAGNSRYAAANDEFARVNWQIDNSHRLQALTLTGVSPEGEILSTPLTYRFDQGTLPQALVPFCTHQARQLRCSNVRTNASKPGEYQFELTLTPRGRPPRQPITAQSSKVVIEPVPLRLPAITDFLPSRVQYLEAAAANATPDSDTATQAEVDRGGIRLNWSITHPETLAALQLTARTADDTPLGDLWFEWPAPSSEPNTLPPTLASSCQLTSAALVCRDFPTQITEAGSYTFTLTAVPRLSDTAEIDPITTATDTVTIQPRVPAIAQFLINGRPAQPKYLVPVSVGQVPPVITLNWQVLGGRSTQVELLPTPGAVPTTGSTRLPLPPSGSTLITLQATNPAGDTIARSVQIETFNPNPEAAAAAAVAASQEAADQPATTTDQPAASSSETADPSRIAPADVPPQFDP